MFLIRGSVMSPKIGVVSETLHLKHKALLPLIFILCFAHNYCVPLQSFSVHVKSSNNFFNGLIVPSTILKIVSLRSFLVLLAQWDSKKFYFHVFPLYFTAKSMYQLSSLCWNRSQMESSDWSFEQPVTQVPSGGLPAPFPGCLSLHGQWDSLLARLLLQVVNVPHWLMT